MTAKNTLNAIVDLYLDRPKAKTFDCNVCDPKLQRLRNCQGKYADAKNMLNGRLYGACPRSILNDNQEEQFLVELYFECKEMKHFPAPGSLADQTAFVYEYFRFLDSIVGAHWDRESQRREYEHSKMLEKLKNMAPRAKPQK